MKAFTSSTQKVMHLGAAANAPRVVRVESVLKKRKMWYGGAGPNNCKSWSRLVYVRAKIGKATTGALAAVASSKISFKLPFQVPYGVMLRLVGSAEELGSWKIVDGVDFKWTEGHNWVLEIDAPVCGPFEYKVVAFNTFTDTVIWESCGNRFLESDERNIEVNLVWNSPSETKIAPMELEDSFGMDGTIVHDLNGTTTWNAEGAIDEESGIDTTGPTSDLPDPSTNHRETSVFSSVVEAGQVPTTGAVQNGAPMDIKPDTPKVESDDPISSGLNGTAENPPLDAMKAASDSTGLTPDDAKANDALGDSQVNLEEGEVEKNQPLAQNGEIMETKPDPSKIEANDPTSLGLSGGITEFAQDAMNPTSDGVVDANIDAKADNVLENSQTSVGEEAIQNQATSQFSDSIQINSDVSITEGGEQTSLGFNDQTVESPLDAKKTTPDSIGFDGGETGPNDVLRDSQSNVDGDQPEKIQPVAQNDETIVTKPDPSSSWGDDPTASGPHSKLVEPAHYVVRANKGGVSSGGVKAEANAVLGDSQTGLDEEETQKFQSTAQTGELMGTQSDSTAVHDGEPISSGKTVEPTLDVMKTTPDSVSPDSEKAEEKYAFRDSESIAEEDVAGKNQPTSQESSMVIDDNSQVAGAVEKSPEPSPGVGSPADIVGSGVVGGVNETAALEQTPLETEASKDVLQGSENLSEDSPSKVVEASNVETMEESNQQAVEEEDDGIVPIAHSYDGSVIYTSEMLEKEIGLESMGLPEVPPPQAPEEVAPEEPTNEADATEDLKVTVDETQELTEKQVDKKSGRKSFGSVLALAALGVGTAALGAIGLELTEAVAVGTFLASGTVAALAVDDAEGRRKEQKKEVVKSAEEEDEEDAYPESKIREASTPGVVLSALLLLPLLAKDKIIGDTKTSDDE